MEAVTESMRASAHFTVCPCVCKWLCVAQENDGTQSADDEGIDTDNDQMKHFATDDNTDMDQDRSGETLKPPDPSRVHRKPALGMCFSTGMTNIIAMTVTQNKVSARCLQAQSVI